MFSIFDKSPYAQGTGAGGFASQGEYNVRGCVLSVNDVYQGSLIGIRRETIQSETAMG